MARRRETVRLEFEVDGHGNLKTRLADTSEGLERVDRSGGKASRSMINFKNAIGALGLGLVVRDLVQTQLQLEKIDSTLRVATGSSEAAARELGWLREQTQRLGLEFVGTAKGAAQFLAATRGTALEGEGARQAMVGLMEAASVYRLNQQEVNGVLKAFEQVASKGTVQAEELRGQIGERIPGAFRLAADAMGVTQGELNKMLETGDVMAEDMLPKLGQALSREVAGELPDAVNSSQASFNRLQNSLTDLKEAVTQSGIIDGLTGLSDWLAEDFIPAMTLAAERVGLFERSVESLSDQDKRIRLEVKKDERSDLQNRLEELQNEIGSLEGSQSIAATRGGMSRGFAGQLQQMQQEAQRVQEEMKAVNAEILQTEAALGNLDAQMMSLDYEDPLGLLGGKDTGDGGSDSGGGDDAGTGNQFENIFGSLDESDPLGLIKQAQAELNALRREGQQVVAAYRTEEEELRMQLEALDEAYAAGQVSAEDYEKTQARIRDRLEEVGEKSEETGKEISTAFESAGRNIQSALADFLFDPFEEGLDGMLKGFLEVIQRMVAEAAAAEIMDELFGSSDPSGDDDGTAGIAAIMQGIFSGASSGSSATGGSIGPGLREVNEDGIETFSTGNKDFLLTSKAGRVTPADAVTMGGGGSKVEIYAPINAQGADVGAASQISQALREFEGRIFNKLGRAAREGRL